MDSSDLTRDQLHQLNAVIGRHLNYLARLRGRMEQVGFPDDDPLFRLVVDAENAIHRLRIELHYAACSGVGRPGRD
jgi:hypothetical protein